MAALYCSVCLVLVLFISFFSFSSSQYPGHFCTTIPPAESDPTMRTRAPEGAVFYAANSPGPLDSSREPKGQICNRLSWYVGLLCDSVTDAYSAFPDQAVKSLCEIWRPQDIPNVFLTSSRAMVGSELPPPPQSRCSAKLPSPISPLAQGSPTCSRAGPPSLQCDQDRTNLVPIKGFVHEVLRRSRTSGSVLQTALCYLEAVRPKVPELSRKQQSGEGSLTEFDSETRVMPATPAELEQEARWAELADLASSTTVDAAGYRNAEDAMDTVRILDEDIACTATPFTAAPDVDGLSPQKVTSSSTPLPSPLLCPRRAFLASLILASKFTQDKSTLR